MSRHKYWVMAVVMLIAGVLLWQGFAGAAEGVEPTAGQSEVKEPASGGKLAVLWTSGDAGVAHNVCLMYTHEAKKHNWFDEIEVIVWGPSAKLAAEDAEIQKKLKEMMTGGVKIEACIVCARNYGVVEKLRELGIVVRGMGRTLTSMLKEDWKVLTF
jgi:hypothetical protein